MKGVQAAKKQRDLPLGKKTRRNKEKRKDNRGESRDARAEFVEVTGAGRKSRKAECGD